jgi:hypothetical protein
VAFLLFPILEISNPLSGFFYPSKRIEVGDLGEGKNRGEFISGVSCHRFGI